MHLQEYIDAGFLVLLTSFLMPFVLATVTIVFGKLFRRTGFRYMVCIVLSW